MNKVDTIKERLANSPYRVSNDVPLASGGRAGVVASRTYFSWKGLVLLSQHIVVREFETLTPEDIRQFSEDGFRLGKSRNRVPLLRGMQFGYMIIPVAVSRSVSDEVCQFVMQQQKKRWALFQFPVVCDVTSGDTFYFNSTPLWGAFFFSDMRNTVTRYIA